MVILGSFGNTTSAFGAKPFGAATTTGGGLFGSSTSTAPASAFGGGTNAFGSGTTAVATPFGSTSLFGGNKTTAFGAANPTPTAGPSLFGGGSFGTGAGTSFGAANNPGLGTNIGDPPGTSTVQFQPFVEKEANSNTNQQNAFQNILFMDNYKKWSSEELRLTDYNQGRKHGSAGGTAGFGVSTAFGAGFGAANPTQSTAFGGGSNSNTSMFGNSQPQTAFGQTTTSGAFGAGGTSLFNNKPATGGLFSTPQTAGTSNAFGSTPAAGFGLTGTAGAGFGGAATGGSSLFPRRQIRPSLPASVFPRPEVRVPLPLAPARPMPSATTRQRLPVAVASLATRTSPACSERADRRPPLHLVPGSAPQPNRQALASSANNNRSPPTSRCLGALPRAPLGACSEALRSRGHLVARLPTSRPAAYSARSPAATGGMFGSTNTAQQGNVGGGMFGGLGQNNQAQQQPQQAGLFGAGMGQNTQQKPSLFGSTTGTGGLFGSQPAQQGGGIFGNAGTQPQQQPSAFGPSAFGNSQGQQSTPQSLTTSINDVSAYGTPSLFQGMGTAEVQNPGPLATPLSGNKLKTSRSSLPMYKLNHATPPRRPFLGFTHSTYGTPNSPPSVASTPGGFGKNLLGGSTRPGLSKSMSSSSLRQSFNPGGSILSPGVFTNSPGPRHYDSFRGTKKLVIQQSLLPTGYLFSTPDKEKQQPAGDSRKLSKRVSFDTSVPAIQNEGEQEESQSPDVSTDSAPSDLGFLRPPKRSNGVTGNNKTAPDAMSETEAKGKELAIVPGGGLHGIAQQASRAQRR